MLRAALSARRAEIEAAVYEGWGFTGIAEAILEQYIGDAFTPGGAGYTLDWGLDVSSPAAPAVGYRCATSVAIGEGYAVETSAARVTRGAAGHPATVRAEIVWPDVPPAFSFAPDTVVIDNFDELLPIMVKSMKIAD
jgi:hypothetical protein